MISARTPVLRPLTAVRALVVLFMLGGMVGCGNRGDAQTDAFVPDVGSDAGDYEVDAAVEYVVLYPLEREIVIRDGVIPRIGLEVRARYGDVESATPLPATFNVTPGRLAMLDGSDLVPTGVAGGLVHVRLQAQGSQRSYVRTETFTVRLETTVLGAGVTAEEIAAIEGVPESTETTSPTLGYPLADARIPMNLASPTFAWPNDGDVRYLDRLEITKPYARITYWGVTGFTPALEPWRGVLRTEVDEPVTLALTRFDRTEMRRGAPTESEVHVARTALSGSVFYWNVAATRIFRVDDGAATNTDFLPRPGGCVGCHTVSPSGRRMIASVSDGFGFEGRAYDLTTDLTGTAPPSLWRVGAEQWYSAVISPDERTVIGTTDRGLVALDLETGAPLLLSRPLTQAANPTFSPDGRHIAYVAAQFPTAVNHGPITVVTFQRDESFIEIGEPRTLTPGEEFLQYPSFSPDGAVLAYGNVNGILTVARVHVDADSRMTIDGQQRLNSGLVGQATHPVFSPFVGDGRYWLSYHSSRSYAPGGEGPFVWVSAIRTEWAPGEDPSEPPYWLIGQSTSDQNLSAYWSRRECRDPREVCTLDVECCSGYCRIPPGNTQGVCSTDLECRIEGESCATNGDCCAADLLECIDNVCVQRVE